jgi:hypothetical protein
VVVVVVLMLTLLPAPRPWLSSSLEACTRHGRTGGGSWPPNGGGGGAPDGSKARLFGELKAEAMTCLARRGEEHLEERGSGPAGSIVRCLRRWVLLRPPRDER